MHNQKTPGLLANILAVAGFIILIVIIVWGAYHILRLAGVGVSNVFSRFTTEKTATTTAPVLPTPTPATAAQQPARQVAQNSTPDLAVRIISAGVIDPATGIFVERTPGPNDTAAVQFDIVNRGTAPSGTYTFAVQLPTQPVYPYLSAAQASLAPGAHIVSTLRFGPVAPGGGTISVEVDSSRAVRDANRNNNTAAIHLFAQTYPYVYQPPFVY